MKKGFLITAALLLIPAAAFFWGGLTEKEQGICEQRARIDRNEFSAKQTYERCKKSIRAELQEIERLARINRMTKKKAWAALVQECKSVQSEWLESQRIQKKVLWQENRSIRELYERPSIEMYARKFKKGSEFEKAKSRQIEIQKMLWSSNVPVVIKAEIAKLESRDKLTKNHPSDPGWAEKFMATCKKPTIPHR